MTKKKNTLQLERLLSSQDFIRQRFARYVMKKRFFVSRLHPDKEELIFQVCKRCYILFLTYLHSSPNLRELISSTLESHRKSSMTTWIGKLTSSDQDQSTLHIGLFKILVLELISREKGLRPYWTPVYKELSEKLWLPIVTDCADLDSNLSSTSLTKPEEKSSLFKIKTTSHDQLNKSCLRTYSPLSTCSAVDKWESVATELAPEVLSKSVKMRLLPNADQKIILNRWLRASNHVYNKASRCVKQNKFQSTDTRLMCDYLVTVTTRKTHEDYSNLQDKIKLAKESNNLDEVKHIRKLIQELPQTKNTNVPKWEAETPKEIRSNAVRDLSKAYKTAFENLKRGNIRKFSVGFRHFNAKRQTMLLQKNMVNVNKKNHLVITSNILKHNSGFKLGKRARKDIETIQSGSVSDCRISKVYNHYFVIFTVTETPPEKKADNLVRVCGIDPGVRTFMTSFGTSGCVEYKQDRSVLRKTNDKLAALRRKFIGPLQEGVKRKRTRRRNMAKYEKRIRHLVDEIHWKTVKDIVRSNDVIFCGDIKSASLLMKTDCPKSVKQEIKDLRFFSFKQRLLYKAAAHSKLAFLVDESYTTQSCTYCGTLTQIGSAEVYTCSGCNCSYPRDQGSARNILMKGVVTKLI